LAANLSPLRLLNRPDPRPPGPDWGRVRPLLSGICGSDLGLLTGRNSPYLSAVVSMPFTPGHEVVGELLDDLPGLAKGSRVVLDPVLGCAARGVDPPCAGCASGDWSRMLVAHFSQLHQVPDDLDDPAAVMVEPLACAIHTVRRVEIPENASVLVVGAGTVGLLTVLALRAHTKAGPVYVVARYP